MTYSELWNAAYDKGIAYGLDDFGAAMYADVTMMELVK